MKDKIMKIINENDIYSELYATDIMFKLQVDNLVDVTSENEDAIINTSINLIYSFQSILTIIMGVIGQCGDNTTINAVNEALEKLLSPNDKEEGDNNVESE